MYKLTSLLRLGIAAGCILLLSSCLEKPVEEAQVEISGDTITFPAFTILQGELVAPAQGPYTRFAGEYPGHWPAAWRLDERFYTPGGAIPQQLKSHAGTDVAVFEFEGAFHGTADDFEQWFSALAQATGVEIESDQLSTTFRVIERRKLGLTLDAWEEAGLSGEVIINYGPRYADYTHFTISIVKFLAGRLETAEREHKH